MKMLTSRYKVPSSKQLIIRPPIDVTIYKPVDRGEACRAFKLEEKKRYFIFIGRLDDRVKRLSTIIDIFATLAKDYPQFDLLIAGNGKDEQNLKHQAKNCAPGRVHFLGWINGDKEKVYALNASDCLLLASLREASPAVISEAFACGVPVISSNVGGIDDLVIENETGWLFVSKDDGRLQSCMENVMRNTARIEPMRKKTRLLAEERVSLEAVTIALRKGFSIV
jgi:glycosyltransferase involved in cell wall biosynthesis